MKKEMIEPKVGYLRTLPISIRPYIVLIKIKKKDMRWQNEIKQQKGFVMASLGMAFAKHDSIGIDVFKRY